MLRFIVHLALFGIQGISATCCVPGGTWSEWVEDTSTCYDYCGGAGNMTRTRSCLSSESCPCEGSDKEIVSCDTSPCIYPRNWTCYSGKTMKVVAGYFKCVSPNEVYVPPAILPPNNCSCCPVGGIWGEWRDAGTCSDTCGACGLINRTRTCLTSQFGCGCSGNIWEMQPCARTPCVGRDLECCLIAVKSTVNGVSTCVGKYSAPPVAKAACCPAVNGSWNEWTSWSICSASCGLCGTRTRTRTCASEDYGCPCTGESTQSQPCGGNACPGRTCCGTNVVVITYDGADICMAKPPVMLPYSGTWTDWKPVTGKICSYGCGAFGSVSSYRFCLPAGTACTGYFFDSVSCNFNVCVYPDQSCAPGYKKVLDQTKTSFLCAL